MLKKESGARSQEPVDVSSKKGMSTDLFRLLTPDSWLLIPFFCRMLQMVRKEFIQILRDPRLRLVIILIPIIQTLIFGYAVNTDVRGVRVGVYDRDQSRASREFLDTVLNSGYFVRAADLTENHQIVPKLDRGDVAVVLQIDHGFQNRLMGGQSAPVQALIDGTDANTAGVVTSYLNKLAGEYSVKLAEDYYHTYTPSMPSPGGVVLETRAWFNDSLESRNYYIPGVIAIILTLALLTLTSMSIVREKELGTIEQLLVTPITRMEFIAGKMIPYVIIGLVDVVGILLVSTYWFEVPIRGSLTLLFFGVCLYLLTALGLGLHISTISNTQQEAMLSAFMYYFPLVMLSGFIFPIANMPKIIQWVTYANPLKYFLIIIRGIFLKGVGLDVLWPEFAVLALIGVLIFWKASSEFHKTIT